MGPKFRWFTSRRMRRRMTMLSSLILLCCAVAWYQSRRALERTLDARLYSSQGPLSMHLYCSGFRGDVEEALRWGSASPEPCPDGYAFFGQDDPPGGSTSFSPGNVVAVNGSCCKLPFPDILTDQHLYNVLDRCPDGYIATGGSASETCGRFCSMRCTKINTDKYQLGEPFPSLYWTRKWSAVAWGGGQALRKDWEEIPVAIRQSIGRLGTSKFDVDGCVGYPFGSLLVEKTRKSCDGFIYRQLLFKDGTPVPVYSPCLEFVDPRAEELQCCDDLGIEELRNAPNCRDAREKAGIHDEPASPDRAGEPL